MSDERSMTRQMWHLLEPVHALLYYAPEAFAEADRLGLGTDTRWPSYFAWRSAPLGEAGPELVAATFYSFSPRTVATYVPAVWSEADSEQVLAARMRAVDSALRRLLGDQAYGPEMAESARLARAAAESADTAGRTLASANADLDWPDEPHLAMWQAATLLREHRGDGHVAALLSAGLDPCEALVSFAAIGAAPVEVFASRGWSEQEWAAAQGRLADRGWVSREGTATDRGRDERLEIERRTDELAAAPWQELGITGTRRLAELTVPVMRAVVASGLLPAQSTLGLGKVAA